MNAPLLEARHLTKYFPIRRGVFARNRPRLHAVDDISLSIGHGETLGLVGESGCGKTTTAKLLVRLLSPTSGQIIFQTGDGAATELGSLRNGAAMKAFRRNAQIIFESPYESLDPRMKVFDLVAEPLEIEGSTDAGERRARVSEMLHTVGLDPVLSLGLRFPHELSGGQRQRVAIARALILHPAFVAADEPTSMLDASIRAGIMNLLLDLAARFQLASLFITHHLAEARYMCRNLAVMYLGKIVETGGTEELLAHPLHPYTRALLSAVPEADPRAKRAPPEILGGVGTPVDPPPQCRFLARCPIAADVCRASLHPPLEDKGAGHRAACYLV